MTTIDTRQAVDSAHGDSGAPGAASSVASVAAVDAWLTTTDHKRVGRLFASCGALMLLVVAILGVLASVQRATDSSDLIDQGALLQLLQGYRVGLVLAALAPLCLGLAIAVTPLQVGSRQIAYPRLALLGFYGWFGGLVLMVAALIDNGGFGGGNAQAVDLFLAAQGLMTLGLAAGAGAVATTVLTSRAPGMSMWRVPLFAWSTLIMSIGLLLTLPVTFGLVIYLFVDHRLGIGANFHGAAGSGTWMAWAFSVPMVIVYSLPALGFVAEMFPVAFRHRPAMRGTQFGAIAIVGIVAALAAATQQASFDVTFNSSVGDFFRGAVPYAIFAGLPVVGSLMMFGLCASAAKPTKGGAGTAPRISAPFIFAFMGFSMVFIGIVGYAMQSIADLNLLGTAFEEGSVLFVVYGATLSVIGGLVFWSPKLTGRTVAGGAASGLALLGVLAVLAAAFPLYIAGMLGQPGGIPMNPADVTAVMSRGDVSGIWMMISLVGHGLMALTVLAAFGLLLKPNKSGSETDDHDKNPYGGQTVEWTTTSPAPSYNFEFVPTVASPTPAFDLTAEGSRA